MTNFGMNSGAKKELLKSLTIVLVSIFASTAISFFLISPKTTAPAISAQNKVKSSVSSGIEKTLFCNNEVIADIVEEITPSVVHIVTEVEHTIVQDPRQFFFEDEFFKRFFGFDSPGFEFRSPSLKRRAEGAGSGTIISEDGYILTNYHVVQNASKIVVKNVNGKEYEAKLVGKDKYSDLAVIKIDEKGLNPAKLSDSDKIRPGQWAIAVGSPHGLDHTVTLGIISAVSRDVPQLSNVSFIQTDAAINPGNSGGPLLNIKGEVVGINTAIIGTAQNIGFAIPVNTASKIIDQLKSGKTIGHPWLGIAMSPLSPELAKALGIPENTDGVVIGKVAYKSPAHEAGLEPGDIIQRIDGKKVSGPKDIQEEVKTKKVGDTINLLILREGEVLGKKVTLGNWGEAQGEG